MTFGTVADCCGGVARILSKLSKPGSSTRQPAVRPHALVAPTSAELPERGRVAATRPMSAPTSGSRRAVAVPRSPPARSVAGQRARWLARGRPALVNAAQTSAVISNSTRQRCAAARACPGLGPGVPSHVPGGAATTRPIRNSSAPVLRLDPVARPHRRSIPG